MQLEWNLSLLMQSKNGGNLLDLQILSKPENKLQTPLELYMGLMELKMPAMEAMPSKQPKEN